MNKKELGDFGEKLAAKYLVRNDYEIIDQNYRIQLGEIDIVAKDKEEYVFVEVKTRTSNQFGQPQEAVDFYKQQKMIKAIFAYLHKYNLDVEFRIDVIAISVNFDTRNARVQHLKDILNEWE